MSKEIEDTRNQPCSPKVYYVDEAGDGDLFSDDGSVIVGTEGCSDFFIVGLADIEAPEELGAKFSALREELMKDPILKRVRQMDPSRRQTAIYFHAKDDPVEVRREVYKILIGHNVKFSAVVKSKWPVLRYVQSRNRKGGKYRYHPNELYDFVLRRLFNDRLHLHQAYQVTFAIRGNRKRTEEFRSALEEARARFAAAHEIDSVTVLDVVPERPQRVAGLQAADYFLWALQRVYQRPNEPGCDRYLNALWEAGRVSLVIDADDTRQTRYGTYYTRKKPLQAAALKSVEEYRTG